MRIGAKDARVLRRFLDGLAAEGHKLSSPDGRRLDGHWLGGNRIAAYGKDGYIHLYDLGSKAAQQVQRALRKAAGPSHTFVYGDSVTVGGDRVRARRRAGKRR